MRSWLALLILLASARAFAQDAGAPAVYLDPELRPLPRSDPRGDALPPDLAFADISDPNPGSGKGKIVTGWILTGAGTVDLLNLTSCSNHGGHVLRANTCLRLFTAISAVAVSLGVPLLILGYRQKHQQQKWKRRHGIAETLQNVQFALEPRREEYGLSYRWSF